MVEIELNIVFSKYVILLAMVDGKLLFSNFTLTSRGPKSKMCLKYW